VLAGSTTIDVVFSQDTQNGVDLSRSDMLIPSGPNGESTVTTVISLPKQNVVVTNSLNGTVSCYTTAASTTPPPPPPPFVFVGGETNSGVKVNHWRQFYGSGPGAYQLDTWTEAADNDVPLYSEVSVNNFTQQRGTYTHFIKCATGSIDPSLFAIPTGLACPALPQSAVPDVSTPVAMMMALFN
jgi:hypothetical protein